MLSKRELGIAVFALSLGIFATFVGFDAARRLAPENHYPLTPGSGQATGSLSIAWLPDTVTRWRRPCVISRHPE